MQFMSSNDAIQRMGTAHLWFNMSQRPRHLRTRVQRCQVHDEGQTQSGFSQTGEAMSFLRPFAGCILGLIVLGLLGGLIGGA